MVTDAPATIPPTLSDPYVLDTSKIPAQREFMESIEPECLYSGAFGAGKSYIGCEKCLFLCLKYPGNVVLIVRKTFQSLKYSTMITFFERVCPPAYIRNYNKTDHIVTLTNGSRIIFLGLDKPEKLGSIECGAVFIDEAIEVDEIDWEMLQGRLRIPTASFYQIFSATNPSTPSHWLYQRMMVNAESGIHKFISSNTLENKWLPQSYIDRLSRFTGNYRRRYVLGEWIGFEGLVYENFDPTRHVVPPFPIDPKWSVFRTIDFGYTNPFVCQWWAKVPPDLSSDHYVHVYPGYRGPGWYMFQEIYMTQRTVEQHVPTIMAMSKGYDIRASFADHDAEDRATLSEHGIPTLPAHKQVSPGLQEVFECIGADEIYFFSDAVREIDWKLKEARKPTSTIAEIPGYEWATAPSHKNEKEVPVDKDDHGMDAMRYLIYSMHIGMDAISHMVVKRKSEAALLGPSKWGRFMIGSSRFNKGMESW